MSYLYSTPAKDDKTPLTKTTSSRVVVDTTTPGMHHNDGKDGIINNINLRDTTPQQQQQPTDRNLLYYPYPNPNTNVSMIGNYQFLIDHKLMQYYNNQPSSNKQHYTYPTINPTSSLNMPSLSYNSPVLHNNNSLSSIMFQQGGGANYNLPSVNYTTPTTPTSSSINNQRRMVGNSTTGNTAQTSPYPSPSYYNTNYHANASRSPTNQQHIDQPTYIGQHPPEGSGSAYVDSLLTTFRQTDNQQQAITPTSKQNNQRGYNTSNAYYDLLYTGTNNQLAVNSSGQYQRPSSSLSNQIPTSTGSSQHQQNLMYSYPNVNQSNYNYYSTGIPNYVSSSGKGTSLSRVNSNSLLPPQPGSTITCPIVVTDEQIAQRSYQNTINNINSRSYSPAYNGNQQPHNYQNNTYPTSLPNNQPTQMPPPQTVVTTTQPTNNNPPPTTQPQQPSSSNSNYPVGLIVGSKYRLMSKLGNGAFGEVFLCQNVEQREEYYAVKLETLPTPQNGQANSGKQQLIYEAKVISYLFNSPPSSNNSSNSNSSSTSNSHVNLPTGIPRVFWYGTEGLYNIMVLELLGQSLESLFKKCNRKFTLKTVLMLADQMIQRIEFTHKRNFVHRDIKPDNFLMGRKVAHNHPGMLQLLSGGGGPYPTNHSLPSPGSENVVYLIDFGLSKMYMTDKGHINLRKDKHLTGTARYASLNNHKGYEQSRRDDLESLGYVLLYFLKGTLPWQGLTGNTKEDHYNNIYQKKKNIKIVNLCKGFPVEFATYLNYTRSLKFCQEPDYTYIRNLFLNLFIREKFSLDYEWDWVVLEKKQRNN